MENLVNLADVVSKEIGEYVVLGIHEADTYLLHDDSSRMYSFINVPHNRLKDTLVVMLARVTDEDKVIIETNLTDRPLYQALIDAGVPSSQIIRAYAGKTQPEP